MRFARRGGRIRTQALMHVYPRPYTTQVAYQALEKVEPVTHAVGNVGKRIFVIGFSILAFGAPPLFAPPPDTSTHV